MKYVYVLAVLLLANGCAYKPVIDTAGRSGTFNENKAKEITNDIQHCKLLAKDHTNNFTEAYKAVYNYYFRPATLWLPDKMEFRYKALVKKCLTNRGHSVLD